MNIMLWNCRGVGNKGFSTLIGDLRARYASNFMILFETHNSGNKAHRIVKKFGFDGFHIVDGDGFSGGI